MESLLVDAKKCDGKVSSRVVCPQILSYHTDRWYLDDPLTSLFDTTEILLSECNSDDPD